MRFLVRKPQRALTVLAENEKQNKFSALSLKVIGLQTTERKSSSWTVIRRKTLVSKRVRRRVGTISHSDSEAELRAASSSSGTLHYCETWIRPWRALRYQSTLVSRRNRVGALARPRRKRHQDTECRQNRASHSSTEATWYAGNGVSTEKAGEPWSPLMRQAK